MSTRITINGVEYNSPDAMPPDVRVQYERIMGMLPDKDGSGIPDLLERIPPTVHIEHRTVRDLSELSEEERALVERALAQQASGRTANQETEPFRITTSRDTHVSIDASNWPRSPAADSARRARGLTVLVLVLLGLLFVLLAS